MVGREADLSHNLEFSVFGEVQPISPHFDHKPKSLAFHRPEIPEIKS